MFIHFGVRLYGKVDVVPGLGFVATKFFSVMLIPIIPLGCWFVEEGSENSKEEDAPAWRGVAIPFAPKSVGFAYGRIAAMIGAFVYGLMAIPGMDHGPVSGWKAAVLAGLCAAAVILSYVFNKASLDRALVLADMAGVPREEVEARFGRRRR